MTEISFDMFTQIREFEWEISPDFRSDMRVPVRIFASKSLLQDSFRDKSIIQAINVSTLPGLVGAVMVMPDMHQGYGFPIGGVAATDIENGVISPGGIGYDINCGVRLLSTKLSYDEIKDYLSILATTINQYCPSGVGVDSDLSLSKNELIEACVKGAKWAKSAGYASQEDILHTEANGCLDGADPSKLSERALSRGRTQLGTLGGGNHFIEVDIVAKVFDEEAAKVLGLCPGEIAVQIHTGSRGFGHQICTDYVRQLQNAVRKYGISLPDKQLVCAPIQSPEGQDYLGAMRCGANFAFLNRQLLTDRLRLAFEKVLAGKVDDWHLKQVYDIAHNIGKFENHNVDGKEKLVCVHRKGATRAFGPGSVGIPDDYAEIGQPVLVPGSMGTASWVLTGTELSMVRSFGSSCHGAGRVMSRSQAKREVWGEDLLKHLEKEGIEIRAGSMAGLAEEAPQAYKDVDQVVESVVGAGIAKKVAVLHPLIVIKG
ncbi:MAG: RtcB family protein [Brevefilum sp.]|nr:RtcB family protein [Brevefilum sp.]MDT8381176.1 RtcB family protein [Brevefilum sp.]MDW7755528.1 RtcB family protein [Brevefilum sp.]